MRADIVEATEFPDLARRFNVYAVPKVVINETSEFVGALPEPHFVAAVARALSGDGGASPPEETGGGETTPLDPGSAQERSRRGKPEEI